MTNSDDVVFGVTLSGRSAPVAGLDEMTGPTIATVPIRVQLTQNQSIANYLETTQRQATEMIPFEQTGLHRIAGFSASLRKECDFQTLLVIQPQDKKSEKGPLGELRNGSQEHVFNTYALTLELHLEADGIMASAMFDSRALEPWMACGLLERLDQVMHQLSHLPTSQPVANVEKSTSQDLDRIWGWNSVVPITIERLVKEEIEDNVQSQPNAPAVCAWDGKLTYIALDQLAIKLAHKLISFGIGADVLVPLCFEKSMWTTVAILWVIKAGGAFVLLDPSLPEQRLQAITQQFKASVILSSTSNREISSRLAQRVIIVNWSFFTAAYSDDVSQNTQQAHPANPRSLVYAVFTSGSTGMPKGVSITNANAASALHHQVECMGISKGSRIYDFASYSFDVSISNVLSALTAGGCLCVPSDQDRRDSLEQSIASLQANIIDITPSVAQVLSPDKIPSLKTLIFGGESLHLADIKRWWGKVQIIHIYGPCECTPTSTINYNSAASPDEAVHMGKGVGLVTWIVDPEDHHILLPPGCTGELLLEGPLVGQGYLNDPTKTAAAFIEDPAWLLRGTSSRPGRRGRLYKTGDLVRYTGDGYLKFISRKETNQVKLRGQRLELGEIEHALRNHARVDEAVAALQHEDGMESRIVSFVTVRDGYAAPEVQPDQCADVQHTEQWKEQFDSEYLPITNIKADSIGRDFMGWTSMYDGSDIDTGEMNEWLDATIETILNGGQADHVLEIGTGSGMILFNLLKGLKSYTGLEPSRRAVDFVTHIASSIEGLANKVKVFEASAVDLGRLPIRHCPNTVVINSVAQYFPSQDYLFRVIQDLLELESVRNKTLFFGDIRSYPLHREFLVVRALYIAGEDAGKDEIRRIVVDLEKAESELLVDPGFFTSLPSRLSGKIAHVEILPKRMHATNELSCYRYDAVIHARDSDCEEQQQILDINDDEWIDFKEQQLDRQSLLGLLQRSTASSVVLAVGNIPYRKILFERRAVDLLDEKEQAAFTEENWLSFARASMQGHPSLAAIDLVEIAAQAGCRVEISWARQYSQRGALDAIFHRYKPINGERRFQFRFPTDHGSRTHRPLTNQPLRQQRRQKIQDELYAMLKSQLPLYMVPQLIEILDSMPLNPAGKTDRQALLKSLQGRITVRGPVRQPASEAQRQMLQVWARVLNIEPSTIGLDDSFFHLGGSSIAAMNAVAEARKIGIKLTVADIFRYPVLHELVNQSYHEPVVDTTQQLIAPFALLDGECDLDFALREISSQYHLDQTDDKMDNAIIRDAYPCTPLQKGLMSLTSKSPGSYIGPNVLELAPDISVRKLCAAWEQAVSNLPILRTRLVHHDRLGLVQIVVDEPIHWIEATSLNDYLDADIEQPMDLGQPLARYALVKDDTGTSKWFVWTIHHALCDGWSMPLILDVVKSAYRGEPDERGRQFQAFIKYITDQDNKMMKDYWLQTFDDCQCAPFPSIPPHIEQPTADTVLDHSFPQPQCNRLGITPPILIRAAWALLVGRMVSADEVVFGVTLSGRNAPLAGIEMIAGPTFATIPVRTKWESSDRATEYLKAVQQQATGMIAYEQIGLHKLTELSSETRQACMFQTLLVVQPPDATCTSDVLGRWRNEMGRGKRFDSYGLMLVVQLSADKASVSASFDSRMIEPWLVDKLLRRLGHVVSQLARTNPELLLSEVETVTPEDLEQIWHWNHTVPAAAEQCVHNLFEQRAQAQPGASAVCAWDGEWTYGELDEGSTRLAHHLTSLGVGPERTVPLCFEKSRWMPVVMLAVMKAGGASVAMDSAQPDERLRTIIQQTEPALVLSSSANREMATRLRVQQVVVVDESLLEKLNSTDATRQLPAVTSSNKLYIVFTSGSTGIPKGAVITHSNFSSAIQHARNSSFSRLEPTARVYDFASYAFDISWFNALQSLTSGACLCIPSEADRTDDLAGSIHRLQATLAILTPSTASLLPSETIQYLQTLMLAGEALPSEYAKRWIGLTQVRNGYGPCECTPITAVAAIDQDNVVASSIGTGLGVNTWVVQASDHNNLVPIGDVGELVLEGPLVGSGYLGDAEKTAAAFVQSPTWLRRGRPGRSGREGRLYKTGDLVRYNPDGSLVFIGRKDATQVKIRGQRVELGEVEHHVHASVPAAKQVAVEVIMPASGDGQARPTLAAFLVDDRGSSSPAAQAMSIPAEVDHELAKRLPGYMVPTAYFSLEKLPINSSGKVDRHRLREIGAGFIVQQLAEPRKTSLGDKRAPATKTEHALQQTWARVLSIDAATIGVDDSFFSLGGDSITAMQASAAARGLKIGISTADILRRKTISSLAAAASVSKQHLLDLDFADTKVDDGQAFGLSPIQQLYVATQPDPNRCFDQTFFLKLREPITFANLEKAIETIVTRHPMLRARFSQTRNGGWKQRIVDDAFNSFHLCQVPGRASGRSTKASDMRQCRERLNIETGPLVAAVLFEDDEGQSLFIAIHHLVIDLVSWRILLEELEELLSRRQLFATSTTTSFRTWCSLQAKYAAENHDLQEAALSQVQPSHLSYWELDIGVNVQGATASKGFVLDEEPSTAILGACNEAFGTRPVELMIAALVPSFSAVFADRPLPTVFSEGHGREPWDDRIDLSRTVGWFTTISPAFTPTKVMDLLDTIRCTKDSVRRLPKNGWSYFTSKFADETNATTSAADFPVEVMLNYAGSYQQLERDDSFFESISVSENSSPASWLQLRRLALFEFNAHVDKGRLAVALEYPKGARHSDMIEALVDTYEATLTHLRPLLKDRSSEWTLTDFPMAFTSYADMHKFRSVVLPRLGITSAQDIEDIYPCTGLQEGLLVAQGKSLSNYRVILDFEIIATEVPGDCIDLSRIECAWRTVVRRHGLLRTILVDMMPGSSRTMQIILKNPTPSISYNQCAGEKGVHGGPNGDQMNLKYGKYDLQHHLSVSKIDEKHVHLYFELNHAILDGHSTGVMLRDFWQAYNGTLSLDGPLYGDFIRYVEQRPRDTDREFWVKYLDGVQPCLFPSSKAAQGQTRDFSIAVPGLDKSGIHDFCAIWEVTTASVIQTAWVLVLYHFTGSVTPCFGNLASGRDVPVERIGDMFGPVIGMIPYRVHLSGDRSVIEILREAHKDFIDSLPHQTYALMEVHEALHIGSSGLFNSILSFQRDIEQPSKSTDGHTIQERGGYDPVEYPIALSVGDSGTNVSIELNFKAGFITRDEAERVARVLSAAVLSLISDPDKKISTVSLLNKDDLERLWAWNSEVPRAEEKFAHHLVKEQAKQRPDAAAVCAKDGEITYKELDRLADRLARRLASMGVGAELMVPLCFEKSMWTPVAALGVLKAGASFALLDPSLPEQRLQSIVQQLGAGVILSSSSNLDLSSRLSQRVVQVGPESADFKFTATEEQTLWIKTPSAPMYIVFTSGSTGTPKGVVLSHSNFCSSLKHQSHLLGFNQSSRVFDFASYSFDIAVHNMFATLATGGCLCIPGEKDKRDNITRTIAEFKTTLVNLTPSVARLIDPVSVPELETMILAGEAVSIDDAKPWWNKAQLVNAYGPAECNISTISCRQSSIEEVTHIGKGAGLVTWVVDPENHNSLMPLGCIGELLLEGSLVGCGYLGDKMKTDAAFIEDPEWLLTGAPGNQQGRHGRLYKTGDLVRYNSDGSLVFIGRKQDTQVKIRGQRVELGEVEHWVQNYMPEATRVVAEVIKLQQAQQESLHSNSLLAMFLQSDDKIMEGDVPDATVKILPIPSGMEGKLAEHLPAYMVPSLFFSMTQLPMTVTGKINRKRLRELGGQISIEYLTQVQTAGRGPKRQPTCEAERIMQSIWAKILNVSANLIGLDDSFFHLGGDSISSMRLVSEARKVHMSMTVADVFRRQTLAELVRGQDMKKVEADQPPKPAVLVDTSMKEALLKEVDSLDLEFCCEDVADILPVTSVQGRCFVEGIYPVACVEQGNAVDMATCGRFLNYLYVDLRGDTDVSHLEKACTQTLSMFPILRACFLRLQGKLWQVVLHQIKQPFRVQDVSEDLDVALRDFCLNDAHEVSPTQPPVALVLLRHMYGMRLIIRISHAQYDGICLPIIFQSLINGDVAIPAPPDFSVFLSYASLRRSQSILYWTRLLRGSRPTGLRTQLLPQGSAEKRQLQTIHLRAETNLPRLPGNITPATLASSAWALLLSRLTRRDDIVYAHLVAGRNSAIPGVDRIVGCCLDYIPVRVTLSSSQTPAELLLSVQQQFLAVGEADSLGYKEMIKNCTDWPVGSGFESTIQHQNIDQNPEVVQSSGVASRVQFFHNPHLVPMSIHMVSETRGDKLGFELNSNTHIMTTETAKAMVDGSLRK